MRALWLHYPDDSVATARGDEYLFGREILVAPVLEKGARTRSLYLPRGTWYDFWNKERVEGGRELIRRVDLETTPLYVRAGAVIAMGPVKQYVSENVTAPITLWIHPGADGASSLYEDDGESFDYRVGEFMRIHLTWSDHQRRLSARLATDSKMIGLLRAEVGRACRRRIDEPGICVSWPPNRNQGVTQLLITIRTLLPEFALQPASGLRMPASVLRSIWHHKDV